MKLKSSLLSPSRLAGRLRLLLAVAAAGLVGGLFQSLHAEDAALSAGADISRYYTVTPILPPPGVDSQVGGMAFLPDGRLAVCFHQGEVGFYNPAKGEWKMFAQGLHEPLGLLPLSNTELLIMQRPELTKVSDTDGDGVADRYETVWDGFGMTGNYHEFAYGPVRDAHGDYFVSLNVASNGASVREEIRGEWSPIGLDRSEFYGTDWKAVKEKAGRMYSRVPWRGWILKIDGKTGEATPWAAGFRSPNGMGFDAEGRLYACDNQGDWLGTSKFFHIEKGGFHGHPASLVWRDGWTRNPLEVDVAELDTLRTRAAVLVPQGVLGNSPTQPVLVEPGGKFGAFENQMLVGEMNYPRVLRMMLEDVAGVMQGACIPLFDGGGLNMGNNRLAFGPDGALWVGQTHLSWAGGQGIQKIMPTGETPPDVKSVKLTEDGFALTFTKPFDTALLKDPANFNVSRYYFEYHEDYGSDEMDKKAAPVKSVEVREDGTGVRLVLGEPLKAGYVYQFRLDALRDAEGNAILNPLFCYTAKRLTDGTDPEPGTQIPRK